MGARPLPRWLLPMSRTKVVMLALPRHLRAFLRREFSHGPDGSFDYGDIGDNAPHSYGIRSLLESALEPSEYGKALQKSSDSALRWAAQAPRGQASLRTLLTVEGISVWDAMAANLALYRIPSGLALRSGPKVQQFLRHPKLNPARADEKSLHRSMGRLQSAIQLTNLRFLSQLRQVRQTEYTSRWQQT